MKNMIRGDRFIVIHPETRQEYKAMYISDTSFVAVSPNGNLMYCLFERCAFTYPLNWIIK